MVKVKRPRRVERPEPESGAKLAALAAAIAAGEIDVSSITRTLPTSLGHVDHESVSRYLSKQEPVVALLRTPKRDALTAGWQWTYLWALSHLQDLDTHPAPTTWSERRDYASVARNLAIAMGIATDKHLLLAGQPTAIIAVHEVRVTMTELASRLAQARQLVGSGSTAAATTDATGGGGRS